MNLLFDLNLAKDYKSNAQVSRVLTESWVRNNIFCINCNNHCLNQFSNNSPVADFYCAKCEQEYELKSKAGILSNKIVDGAYSTMISRIESENNPNFFFLTYDKSKWAVHNFLIIPRHYFIYSTIEKRKPLSLNAKRAGWTGCNILLDTIPSTGKIYIIKDGSALSRDSVLNKWKETEFLRNTNVTTKGWLLDILNCIDRIPTQNFSLEDIYKFEAHLKSRHLSNNFIRDKIRQQLQVLRDRGIIDFVGRGLYKKRNQQT